jgi:DNA-binding NarL/FixJ family response regulator
MTIRVLIADDDVLVRAGLRLMIETQDDLEVVGEAGDGHEAVELAASLQPDVVLMDVRMPGMDGLEATRRIAGYRAGPGPSGDHASGGDAADEAADAEDVGPRVLVLTTFEIDDYVYEAVRAGASGFLLKRTPPEELLDGIRVVASGDALLAPSVTRRLLAEFARVSGADDDRPVVTPHPELDLLTEREREVLLQIARGLSNREIAERLYISESTAKTHVKRILMKLGLRDRVHAVVLAYESGLTVPGQGPA